MRPDVLWHHAMGNEQHLEAWLHAVRGGRGGHKPAVDDDYERRYGSPSPDTAALAMWKASTALCGAWCADAAASPTAAARVAIVAASSRTTGVAGAAAANSAQTPTPAECAADPFTTTHTSDGVVWRGARGVWAALRHAVLMLRLLTILESDLAYMHGIELGWVALVLHCVTLTSLCNACSPSYQGRNGTLAAQKRGSCIPKPSTAAD